MGVLPGWMPEVVGQAGRQAGRQAGGKAGKMMDGVTCWMGDVLDGVTMGDEDG